MQVFKRLQADEGVVCLALDPEGEFLAAATVKGLLQVEARYCLYRL